MNEAEFRLFVIVAKTNGNYLSANTDLFTSDLGRARMFPSRESAQEMIRSCVALEHRAEFRAARMAVERMAMSNPHWKKSL